MMAEEKLRAQIIQAAEWVLEARKSDAIELIAWRAKLYEIDPSCTVDRIRYYIDGVQTLLQDEGYKGFWNDAKSKNYSVASIIDVFWLDEPLPRIAKSTARESLLLVSEKIEEIINILERDEILSLHSIIALKSTINETLVDKQYGFSQPEFKIDTASSFLKSWGEKIKSKDVISKGITHEYKFDLLYENVGIQPKHETSEKTFYSNRLVNKMRGVTGKPQYEISADLLNLFRPDLAPFTIASLKSAQRTAKSSEPKRQNKKVRPLSVL